MKSSNFDLDSSSSCPWSSSMISCITSARRSFTSPSSATRNPGSRSVVWQYALTIYEQNPSMVVICALWIREDWRCKCSLSGSSARASVIALPILSRISPAAALVNVTINSRSMSTGSFGSMIYARMRATSTAVLPLPAEALTRMLSSLLSITFCWSGVHCICLLLLFYRLLYCFRCSLLPFLFHLL